MLERSEGETEIRYLFVGEKRSDLAIKNGYTWDTVPDQSPHCSRKLFVALRKIGIEPKDHDFENAWDDQGNPQEIVPGERIVVAMGKKVQCELESRGVEFVSLVHPAARGKWCRQDEYNAMVESVLKTTSESI